LEGRPPKDTSARNPAAHVRNGAAPPEEALMSRNMFETQPVARSTREQEDKPTRFAAPGLLSDSAILFNKQRRYLTSAK